MFKLVIHQIFATLPKDVTLYLEDEAMAHKVSAELIKDSSVLDVSIYKDDKVIKKFKNEVNFVKFYNTRS